MIFELISGSGKKSKATDAKGLHMKWNSMKWLAGALLLAMQVSSATSTRTEILRVIIKTDTREERIRLVESGFAVDAVMPTQSVVYASPVNIREIQKQHFEILATEPIIKLLDFPSDDAAYHNYDETLSELKALKDKAPGLVNLEVIGKSTEGRDIWMLKLSMGASPNKPVVNFMGGHHAREHLSVEVPLGVAKYLVQEYLNQNAHIMELLNDVNVHIIPMVNPDGLEYDIANGDYKYWRKNRRNNRDGSYGVDLNRNYDKEWGTVGASGRSRDETYRGEKAFSEAETQVIRDYVLRTPQMRSMISFHTYSKLVLYPWGYTNQAIPNSSDLKLFEEMANQMAKWNGYQPMQSSDLYPASGDLTDWAYAERRIFAFTFELDPDQSDWSGGGFYPGAAIINDVIKKNLDPVVYLIEKTRSGALK